MIVTPKHTECHIVVFISSEKILFDKTYYLIRPRSCNFFLGMIKKREAIFKDYSLTDS